MPIPLLAGGIISAAGSFLNAQGQQRANDQQLMFSDRMYEKQKRDNLEFWNMQNEYNSPAAQMKRFQEAGLNPNLIYGQGNAGNATPVQTPDVQGVQFRNPEYGNAVSTFGLGYLNTMADIEIKQAQAKNLQTQNSIYAQDALLRAVQIDKVVADTDYTRFGLKYKQDMSAISGDILREQLRQLKVNTDVSINRDAREAAANSSSIKEAAERMLTMQDQRKTNYVQRHQMRQTISNLEKDGTLKEIEIALRKDGINPSDPMWARVVGKFLNDVLSDKPSEDSKSSFWRYLFR